MTTRPLHRLFGSLQQLARGLGRRGAAAAAAAGERQGLLHDGDGDGARDGDPVCWCCWESGAAADNPLVRACLGCRDADLQLIHQRCIDAYVSALPLPRNAPSRGHVFRCTRCADPYTVEETPVPRLAVIARDRFLAAAFATMLVCILTLTVCCVSLILENWGSNNLLFDVDLGFVHLSMSIVFFAILMLIVCHALNSITLCIMLDFAKGRVTRHVVGISADRIAAFSANNSLESCASRSEVIVRVDAV